MATYGELFTILANPGLLEDKVGIAALITADKIKSGNDDIAPFDQTAGAHEKRLKWANSVYLNPRGIAKQVLGAVLAANNTSSVAQITGASDATIQTAVDEVADVFATALGSPPA